MAASVSIIVCTVGRLKELERCLISIRNRRADDELLIIASGCDPALLTPVAQRFAGRVIPVLESGLSRARNAGATTSQCDVIAYIDDDAVASESWLDALRAAFANPEIAAVAGPVLPLQTAGHGTVFLPANANRAERALLNQSTPNWVQVINFGGIVSGANMAIRRSMFVDGLRFDAQLGLGGSIPAGEEQYCFFKLIERGNTVLYDPDVAVLHHLPSDPQEITSKSRRRLRAAAAYMAFLILREPVARLPVLRYVAMWPFRKSRRPVAMTAPVDVSTR